MPLPGMMSNDPVSQLYARIELFASSRKLGELERKLFEMNMMKVLRIELFEEWQKSIEETGKVQLYRDFAFEFYSESDDFAELAERVWDRASREFDDVLNDPNVTEANKGKSIWGTVVELVAPFIKKG